MPRADQWRFHHHPSNPFLYADFNMLDLQDVTGYNVVVESVCHTHDHGKVQARAVGKLVEHFDVQ